MTWNVGVGVGVVVCLQYQEDGKDIGPFIPTLLTKGSPRTGIYEQQKLWTPNGSRFKKTRFET